MSDCTPRTLGFFLDMPEDSPLGILVTATAAQFHNQLNMISIISQCHTSDILIIILEIAPTDAKQPCCALMETI